MTLFLILVILKIQKQTIMIFDIFKIKSDLKSLVNQSKNILNQIENIDNRKWEVQEFLTQLEKKKSETIEELKLIRESVEEKKKELEVLKKELSTGNPMMADLISDYYYYRDLKTSHYLKSKKHSAVKSANDVKIFAKENKELRRSNRIIYNQLKLYENLFPFITELEPEDIDFILNQKTNKKIIADNGDPVREYVPEYDKLNEEERNQRALNRYLKSKKSNWEIGKMYERYVGYLYESKGYKVEYVGIEKGFEDLGRDLICRNSKETLVVQCKYWASHKEIREAHINQLYGTTVKHFIDEFKNRSEKLKNTLFPDLLARDEVKIKPVFFTSTKLSKTAEDFANALGIQIIQERPFDQNYL